MAILVEDSHPTECRGPVVQVQVPESGEVRICFGINFNIFGEVSVESVINP